MIVLEKSRLYAVCKLEWGDAPFQNPFLLDEDHDDTPPNAVVATTATTTHPPSMTRTTARQVNETLNLCLGRPDLFNRQQHIRWVRVIDYVHRCLLIWWEDRIIFPCYNAIPVVWRRHIIYTVWQYLYLPFHQWCLTYHHQRRRGTSRRHRRCRTTAIHNDCSDEYHALTTVAFWGRFFPMTIPRMRFFLHQLTALSPPRRSVSLVSSSSSSSSKLFFVFRPEQVVNVPVDVPADTVLVGEKYYADHTLANGLYLHYDPRGVTKAATTTTTTTTMSSSNNDDDDNNRNDYVLLWYYGGAFMGGDAVGQTGPAEWVVQLSQTTMDVYIPTIRLAPEVNILGILWDVVLAYRYLYHRRQKEGYDPSKILLFGCSSGGALVLRLLQLLQTVQPTTLSSHNDKEENDTSTTGLRRAVRPAGLLAPLLRGLGTAAGAAVVSPFLDFRRHGKDLDGSFYQYARHDLVVNEAVQEMALPYLDTHMNVYYDDDTIKDHSPLAHNLTGLPPLLILVSEHETVHDETMALIHQIQQQHHQQATAALSSGTTTTTTTTDTTSTTTTTTLDITIGYYRYMCHVWLFYHGFLPEGQHAMQLLGTWYREQQK